MLLKKSSRSFTNLSKRRSRRVGLIFDWIKQNRKKFLLLLLLVPVLFLVNNFFVIKKIECVENNQLCPSEIYTVAERLIGSNSILINQKELINKLKTTYPVDKITSGFQFPNTLKITLLGVRPNIGADVYLVKDLPVFSMDQAPSTTDSASWWIKPTKEIDEFISTKEALGFFLSENGTMSSAATMGANFKYIFSEKPNTTTLASIYQMIKIISKYVDYSNIYIVNQRCFLSRPDQPDIIVGVPFDEGSLVPALQSLSYLATIKKDAKVIDLSFKNPIIR